MPDPKSNEVSTLLASRWTPTGKNRIDPGADVILTFHGLMCLCHHTDGFCEVGILNTDPGRHELGIYVLEVDDSFDPPDKLDLGAVRLLEPFYTTGDTGTLFTNVIEISVSKPKPTFEGVKFFVPGGRPKTNPSDFRFITDLEGPGFYNGEVVGKVPEALGPRLHVSDAVFYTLCKTGQMFLSREEGEPRPNDINSIARIIGANIYLDKTEPDPGYVTLKINPQVTRRIPNTPGKKHLIFIDNSCPSDLCDPEHGDFAFYYDAFIPPGVPPRRRRRILLEKGKPGTGTIEGPCDPDFLDKINGVLGDFAVKRFLTASDDSPCGAAGTGSSGSLGPEG